MDLLKLAASLDHTAATAILLDSLGRATTAQLPVILRLFHLLARPDGAAVTALLKVANNLSLTAKAREVALFAAAVVAKKLGPERAATKELDRQLCRGVQENVGQERLSFAHALGNLGSSTCLVALRQASTDPDQRVAQAATLALSRMGKN